jgi:hypothetical protein
LLPKDEQSPAWRYPQEKKGGGEEGAFSRFDLCEPFEACFTSNKIEATLENACRAVAGQGMLRSRTKNFSYN